MKELSIEEKAKAYDKALEKARQLCAYPTSKPFISDLQDLFPELKELEGERIRKDIVEAIELHKDFTQERKEHIYAWLERQSEQKSLDDVAKEITKNKETAMSFLKSCGIMNANRELADEYKIEQCEQKLAKQPNCYELEEEIEEWLGCEAFPEGTNITPLPKAMDIVRETAYHFYDFGRKQQAIRNIQCTNSQVITPESYINEGQKKGIQMVLDNPKEYGLQNPADKVEPKFKVGDKIWHKNYKGECIYHIIRIENNNYIGDDNTSIFISTADKEYELVEKQGEQKPAEWSDEDEDMLYKAIAVINRLCAEGKDYVWSIKTLKKLFYWLKSLKVRVQPQPKQEWSEDDKYYYGIIQYIINGECVGKTDEENAINWFKSLKPRPKQEWSEEDERNASYICAALECYYRLREERNNTNGQEDLNKARNWLYDKLKSLNPQNHWKPSDEQMKALEKAMSMGAKLDSLYNELKKLKD